MATAPTRATLDVANAVRVLDGTQPLLTVATAQLADVVSTTQDAAMAVMSGVQDADVEADALSRFARELARTAESDAARVAEATSASARSVDELVALVTERDTAVLELVDEVRSLYRYVEAVALVARTTNILAINAKIEAARAGSAGEGFSVVANEVRSLSRESAVAADDIRNGIARVTALMEQRLRPQPTGDGKVVTINDRLQTIAADQRDAAAMLSDTVRNTQSAVEHVEQSAQSLSRRTTAILGEAQFQDITRQTIESVVAGLGELGRRVGSVSSHLGSDGDTDLAGVAASADTFEDTYVSSRQRDIHAAATGVEAMTDDQPIIELF